MPKIAIIMAAGSLIAAAHGVEIRTKDPVTVEVEADNYDLAADVCVGAGRVDLLPGLEHNEDVPVFDGAGNPAGHEEVTVRYNPIGQRMIQNVEQKEAEAAHIASAGSASPVATQAPVVEPPAGESGEGNSIEIIS